jgi:hypothetical protein
MPKIPEGTTKQEGRARAQTDRETMETEADTTAEIAMNTKRERTSEKTRVRMTEEHIRAGTPGSHTGCATAAAVREHYRAPGGAREPLPPGRVRVEMNHTRILNGKKETVRRIRHSHAATMWVIGTDQGTAKPATLVIDWENDTMDLETDVETDAETDAETARRE